MAERDWFHQFKLEGKAATYDDGTTALAIAGAYVLDFFHVPTGRSIAFKAMLNSFSDQYSSDWSTEKVYGRMDPIAQFQGTERVISLDWDLVASSVEEAKLNMQKCQELMSMLYPTYEASSGDSSATLINTSPLFKFKFGNFAMDASAGMESAAARAETAGLVGFIGGFTFEPDFESGIMEDRQGVFGGEVHGLGHFFPQHLKLSAEFTVLHTHKLGFEAGEKREESFPYGQQSSVEDSESDTPSDSEVSDWLEAAGIEIGGA